MTSVPQKINYTQILFAKASKKIKLKKFVSDFNCQDIFGNTPLHAAVENNSLEAIDFLLQM